jgi:endonuclease/exonuclease/phosphatase family metal-dependent hydrolase
MNTLVTLAACGVLFSTGLVLAQPADTQPKNDPAQAKPFKVMSFNIRWGGAADPPSVWSKRKDRVIGVIKASDPDVLGVQEAILRQVRFLQNNLEGYVFYGVGRDNGVKAGEMCAIFYKSERFLRVGGGHFWLSEEPDTPGSYGWDARFPRMVTWLKLRDKATRKTMIVANTHWDHHGDEARLNSAKLIREMIPEIAEGDPVVILGDFNCTEDSQPYAELLVGGEGQSPWLIDAYRAVHPERQKQEATYHGFRGGIEGDRIDWVLHSPGFTTIDAQIDRTHEGLKYPSDHYPVTATLLRTD